MRLEGQRLGRYYLSRLLGSGGMGEVYLAEDPRIEQQVAIKVVSSEATPYPDIETSKEATSLFLREVRAIAKLDHPNILPLFDYGEEHIGEMKITYIVMPYRKEGSLSTWLRQNRGKELLSMQEMAYFLSQATDALQHAHDNQIIHQDVKPSNFLLRGRKENPNYPLLLLSDFGIAKFYSATSNASATIRGTPTYMAPEQWRGHPVYATDQYALAVMVYQLLVGRPPFQGGLEQIMYMHINDQPPPPSTFNPRISPSIDAVLLQTLSKKAEERFPTISAFAQAFQKALQRTDLPTDPATPPSSPPAKTAGSDLHATLAISQSEAVSGTFRTLTLPGGRQVVLPVKAGAYNGQIIRLEGVVDQASPGVPAGTLVITLAISQAEQFAPQFNSQRDTEETRLASFTKDTPPSHESEAERTRLASFTRTNPATPSAASLNRITPVPPTPNFISLGQDNKQRRRGISRGVIALLVALALLVVGASIAGIFYITTTNQIATQHSNATATANGGTAIAATATASWFPYPPNKGMLVLNDPLSDNSKGYDWVIGYNRYPGADCVFTGGAYHVIELNTQRFYYCIANNIRLSNFVFEVQMRFIKGNVGYGGILFRSQAQRHYFFRIGQNGSYKLALYRDDIVGVKLATGTSPAIHRNLNDPNILAVVARGSNIDLYVNQQLIASVADSAYGIGQIGFAAENEVAPVEAVFSNAKVWTL
jgi:serine/threonine protein kinase